MPAIFQGNFLVEKCCVNSSLRYKLMYQYENSAEEEKHALYFAKPVVVHCKNNLVKCLKVVLMGGGVELSKASLYGAEYSSLIPAQSKNN